MAEETEEEAETPPTQGAVIDPALRSDGTDSLSKKELRKLAREQLEGDWKNFPDLPRNTSLKDENVAR
jgi:hypothetical protein